MAIQKKPEEVKQGAPEYMNTYGDMVTLLLCFFVLLFAMSVVDAQKFQAVAASFGGAPFARNSGGKDHIRDLMGSGVRQMPSVAESKKATSNKKAMGEAAMEELQRMSADFKTYFAENNIADNVGVEVTENEVVLTFPDGILFDVGRANLKPEVLPVLDLVAEKIAEYPENDVQIEGHTDSDPINTPQYPSNLYLSTARAIAVFTFFVDEKGFDPVALAATGKGEYVPVAPNDTAENKAKNRRVEIKVKSKYYSSAFQSQEAAGGVVLT